MLPRTQNCHYSRVWLARWWLPPALEDLAAILENLVELFAARARAAPTHRLPRRLEPNPPPSYSRHKARDRTVVSGEVRRSMGKRRLPAISLDPMKFLQAFAAGLRAEFAGAGCAPVPEYLAALMQQLDGDRNEHSGEGREYGASPTESSSSVDCRGCRRTAPLRGEAA